MPQLTPKAISGWPARYRVAALVVAAIMPAACTLYGDKTASPVPRMLTQVAQMSGSAASGNGASSSTPSGSYLAGRHAERRRDVGAAARFLTDALAADPENWSLKRRTFLLMVSDGRVEEAAELARQIVAVRENEPISNLLLAIEAARAGQYLDAGERLAGLPRRGGNEILVPLLLGWVWFGEGKPDEAINALAPLSKVKGFEGFFELHSAALLDLAGRTEAAGQAYARALGGSKRPSLRLLLAVASFYQRTGREREARTLLAGHLKEASNSMMARAALADLDAGKTLPRLVGSASHGMAEALFNVSSALYQENVTQTALVYGRLALHLRPNFPASRLLVANVLEVSGRREKAIAEYRAIDLASPLSWNARLAVARNLDDLKRIDEAVSLLQAMVDERPKRSDALIALGDLFRSHERFEEAVGAYDRAFKRVKEVQNRHWGLFYARGIALERSKKWARAEKNFLEALKLQPEQPYVLNYLGYSWVEQGINLDRAKAMLRTAMSLRRDDGYITDSLGWALFRTGDFDGAVTHLERAVELRPHDATINDHLGDAYWRVGRTHEARFQWRRALSLDPAAELVPQIEGKLENGLGEIEKAGSNQ